MIEWLKDIATVFGLILFLVIYITAFIPGMIALTFAALIYGHVIYRSH